MKANSFVVLKIRGALRILATAFAIATTFESVAVMIGFQPRHFGLERS